MKKELELKNEEIQRNRQEINELRRDIKFHKEMAISAGNLMHKQMNTTVLYLMNKYPNAPSLEAITELDLQNRYICPEKIQEIEEITAGKEDEETKEITDKLKRVEIGKILTYIFLEGTFVSEMIDLIKSLYKKDDKSKQSAWTTDTSRKSYYIKMEKKENFDEELKEQVEKDLTNSGWKYDPRGTEFKLKTIEPLMTFILSYAEIYHDSLVEQIQNYRINKKIDPTKIALEIGDVCLFIINLKKKNFENDIVSSITPIFHLDKS